ncbi:MAG: hypothetical protein ACN6OP_22295, partial [Pseudomonadales bacterium]
LFIDLFYLFYKFIEWVMIISFCDQVKVWTWLVMAAVSMGKECRRIPENRMLSVCAGLPAIEASQ